MKKAKYLIMGIIIGVIISSMCIYADDIMIAIEKLPLKYMINGVEAIPAEGEEGFIYNDRTYVPIRFVAENLGNEVGWNEEDYTVSIDDNKEVSYEVINLDEISCTYTMNIMELKNYEKMLAEYNGLEAYLIGYYDGKFVIDILTESDLYDMGVLCIYNTKDDSYELIEDSYHVCGLIGGNTYIKMIDNYLVMCNYVDYNTDDEKDVTRIYNLDDNSKCFEVYDCYDVVRVVYDYGGYYITYFKIHDEDNKSILYKFDTSTNTEKEIVTFPFDYTDVKVENSRIYCRYAYGEGALIYSCRFDGSDLMEETWMEEGIRDIANYKRIKAFDEIRPFERKKAYPYDMEMVH